MISYRYIFGPVFSKRLGLSLGIDLLGKKICSFNCVYCEISKTEILTLSPDKYVPIERIFFELDYFFLFNPKIDIDCITISGKGEPTLHSEIDEVIEYLHLNYAYPIYILTNSSLLSLESIRKKILKADGIMPSLNAVSERVYKRINLHHSKICVGEVIKGIFSLRKEFKGYFCLEILFVKGINDHEEEIVLLKEIVKKLQPDDVYINTIYRPPAFKGFKRIDSLVLDRLNTKFKALLFSYKKKEFKGETNEDRVNLDVVIEEEILEKLKMILYIRPSLKKDLKRILSSYGYKMSTINCEELIESLLRKGILSEKVIEQDIYIYLNNF